MFVETKVASFFRGWRLAHSDSEVFFTTNVIGKSFLYNRKFPTELDMGAWGVYGGRMDNFYELRTPEYTISYHTTLAKAVLAADEYVSSIMSKWIRTEWAAASVGWYRHHQFGLINIYQRHFSS
jgi:hypothetical protein